MRSKNKFHKWIILACGLIIIGVIVTGIIFISSYLKAANNTFVINGENISRFDVHYLYNDFFPDNPVPPDVHFLMSFTDFFKIHNYFFVEFSQETKVEYDFLASMTFVIRNAVTPDNNLNPIVMRDKMVLAEGSDSIVTSRLDFLDLDDDNLYGAFIIDPMELIGLYRIFVETQIHQMEERNIMVIGNRSFSAELLVDFSFNLYMPEFDHKESSVSGFRIPLSSEVYSPTATGDPRFYTSLNPNTNQATSLSMPLIAVLLSLLIIALAGLICSIRKLFSGFNPTEHEAVVIFRKYRNEIVGSIDPIDISGYKIVKLDDFSELLKLSIGLNKHIAGFRNDERAEFITIVDDYAYVYNIDFAS